MQWGLLVAIAVGGGLGSLARHFLSSGIYAATGTAFPWGIFVVNILGGLFMGLIVELGALKMNMSLEMRAFLTTGFLGGFTTFSTFSLEAVRLVQQHHLASAALYVGGSLLLGFAACWLGLTLGRP